MGRQDHEGTLDEWGEGLSPALSCPVTGLCITSSPPLSALPSALGLRLRILSCAKPGPTHSRMGAESIEEPREDDASRRQLTAGREKGKCWNLLSTPHAPRRDIPPWPGGCVCRRPSTRLPVWSRRREDGGKTYHSAGHLRQAPAFPLRTSIKASLN